MLKLNGKMMQRCSLYTMFILITVNLIRPECPTIVSREEWGARATLSNVSMTNPVQYVIIHHSEGTPCNTTSDCYRIVRGIQDLHMDRNGWDDIGYSFTIGENGHVYMARGWSRVGAHSPGYNANSIGICIMGNFRTQLPDLKALLVAMQLIQCGVENKYIAPNYTLKGHRDAGTSWNSTDCPGESLYRLIQTWPNYG